MPNTITGGNPVRPGLGGTCPVGYKLDPTLNMCFPIISSAKNAGLPPLVNIPNPLSGIAGVNDFLSRLSQGSTWIRVGESLLGIVLIFVGVNAIAYATPVGKKLRGKAGSIIKSKAFPI